MAHSDELSAGAIAGIVIACVVGSVLFVVSLLCLCRCWLRRRNAHRMHLGLEQPFDVERGSRAKDTELVTSPNVVIAELDDAEKLAMNGLPVMGNQSPSKLLQQQQMGRSASADPRLQQTGSSNAIMRWLESAELASPRSHAGAAGGPAGTAHSASARSDQLSGGIKSPSPVRSLISGKLSNLSFKNITGRLDTAELADMRRRLLAAATGGYAGDSSTAPVDVKGVVFSRLPPSRRASPAPSTIEAASTVSRARQARRSDAGAEDRAAPGEMAPEEQLANPPQLARTSRDLIRMSSGGGGSGGGAPTASAGGMAFARIDSFTRRSATMPRKLDVSDSGAAPGELSPQEQLPPLPRAPGSRNRSQSGTAPRPGGPPTSPQLTYAEAMAALDQATSPVPSLPQSQRARDADPAAAPLAVPPRIVPPSQFSPGAPVYTPASDLTSPAGSRSAALSPRTPASQPASTPR